MGLDWVEETATFDAIDPAVKAIEANPGWKLLHVGTGSGGQTTLTYGWPYPSEDDGLAAPALDSLVPGSVWVWNIDSIYRALVVVSSIDCHRPERTADWSVTYKKLPTWASSVVSSVTVRLSEFMEHAHPVDYILGDVHWRN